MRIQTKHIYLEDQFQANFLGYLSDMKCAIIHIEKLEKLWQLKFLIDTKQNFS